MERYGRILLSRLKFIGDVVLTTPLIRALRDEYPGAFIAYLGDSCTVSLLENNPFLNEIIPYSYSRPSFFEQARVIKELRRKKFDVFIDLFSNPRSALLSRLSGAPVRIGKDVPGRGRWFTHRISDDGSPKTAIEFHYQYLVPLGVNKKSWKTEIFLKEEEQSSAKRLLEGYGYDTGRPVIGLHPGGTWPAKRWLYENFASLANRLTEEMDVQVLLTQGYGEDNILSEIRKTIKPGVKIIDVMKLRPLAALLSQLALYVSNDSGPMHISAAVGTKTIGIFGPGEEKIWFPYSPPFYPAGSGHTALRKDVPCHPCHLNVCNRRGEENMECMKLLGVGEVLEHIGKIL